MNALNISVLLKYTKLYKKIFQIWFLLNPFGDPLYDDYKYGYDQLDPENHFTITLSTWPNTYQYYKQTIRMNDNKPQAKLSIKNFSCLRELAENIVKTTPRSSIQKNTSSNHLLKVIFEYKNFRDFIFRHAT